MEVETIGNITRFQIGASGSDSNWVSGEDLHSYSLEKGQYLWAEIDFCSDGSDLDINPLSLSLRASRAGDVSTTWRISCSFYTGNPFTGGSIYKTKTASISGATTLASVEFDATKTGALKRYLYVRINIPSAASLDRLYNISLSSPANVIVDVPEVTLSSPISITKDGDETIRFSWSVSDTGTNSKRNTLYWKKEEESENSWRSVTTSDKDYYEFSPGKLPLGNIQWYVLSRNGYVNGRSSVSSFAVNYDTPVVTIISPSSAELSGDSPIHFEWALTKGEGSIIWTEVQYSLNGGIYSYLITGQEYFSEYNAPAHKFTSPGTLQWRVRCNHKYAGVGEWATGEFTVVYDTPTVTNLTPDNAIVPGVSGIDLNWNIGNGSGNISGTEVEYSVDGGETYNLLKSSSSAIYTARIDRSQAPSRTEIFWRVRAKDQYAGWSEWVQASFVAAESTPTVSNLKPNGIYKEKTEPITFVWNASITYGAIAGSELEYDVSDGQGWQSLGTVTGSATSYTVPANTFPAANPLKWRVRAYNGDGIASLWAEASINTAESIPTVSNLKPNGTYQEKAEPITLSWSSSVTKGAIAEAALEYSTNAGETWLDLGTVTGSETSYTVPANTFPAVAYTDPAQRTGGIRIRVRSKNRDNVYSSWTESSISTVDAPTTASPNAPVNGASRNEKQQITFQWSTANAIGSTPTGADLQYRYPDGTWQTLGHVDGSLKSFTAEPDTFIGAVVYWRVRAYNQDGIAGDWSSEAYFSTVDKPQVSTALSPSGTIEDADESITFVWATSSQSGEASRGADLQYSPDNVAWVNLGPSVESGPQIPGNVHQYEVPGDTLPPSVIFWRVRSYNRNMSAGDWSTVVSFVARAAPTVQDISAIAKPWATVMWQTDDQQTFEVFVDGKSLGSYFGTEKQFPLPDYLEDGVHTVGVRVMGSFGLWSQINETQITIENDPGTEIALKAITNVDTELEWEGGDGDFFVYRDGLMIAHTNAHSFTDRAALGTHEYRVIERLASGDYNASETITRTPAVPYQHIAALAGGDWIGIPHTLKSQSDPTYQESQEAAFDYLSGNDYPAASIGSHRTDTGQYSAVFLYTEEDANKAFLALRGKPVILKTADDEVVIGVLHAWEHWPKSSREKKYYTAYTFSLQRIGWEDFIDDTI